MKTPQQIKDEEADIQKRMCQAQYPLGVLLIEKETRTEYDKSIKEMIEKVYQYLKENEDEKLNSFPDEVAIRLQSGFLLGYADGIVKFREKLLSKIGEEKQDDK